MNEERVICVTNNRRCCASQVNCLVVTLRNNSNSSYVCSRGIDRCELNRNNR